MALISGSYVRREETFGAKNQIWMVTWAQLRTSATASFKILPRSDTSALTSTGPLTSSTGPVRLRSAACQLGATRVRSRRVPPVTTIRTVTGSRLGSRAPRITGQPRVTRPQGHRLRCIFRLFGLHLRLLVFLFELRADVIADAPRVESLATLIVREEPVE